MAGLFEPILVPDALDAWLVAEIDYCFASVPHGEALRRVWARARSNFERMDVGFAGMSPEARAFSAPFRASFLVSRGHIPGYQGIVERALRLVQMADQRQDAAPLQHIAVATLPTNLRYAAVYRPQVVPDWHVIAIDWGFLCGLWGLSACFATLAAAPGNEPQSSIASLDPDQLRRGVTREADALVPLFTDVVVPCIVAGQMPPVPLPAPLDPAKMVVTGALFQSMLFNVVAHEYGHLRRDHLTERSASASRRYQMEYEADGLALVYALMNPWKQIPGFDSQAAWQMAAGAQALVLSFIGMLEMGDWMLDDLAQRPRRTHSHPPAKTRLEAVQYMLNARLRIEDPVKRLVNASCAGFAVFADELWNQSRRRILTKLSELNRDVATATVHPRGVDLRFH